MEFTLRSSLITNNMLWRVPWPGVVGTLEVTGGADDRGDAGGDLRGGAGNGRRAVSNGAMVATSSNSAKRNA